MLSPYYVLIIPFAYLVHTALSLLSNRKRAGQINLRIVVSPVDNINTVWILTQRWLLPLIKRLPFGLGSFARYNHRGWQFDDKYNMHAELGDAWVHVTPVQNQVYIANAEAAEEVFLRRKDFVKPTYFYKLLELFGKNVNTVEGHDWIRHRRITAPPLNERNNSIVWAESLHQAREMLAWWTRQDSSTINSTDKDVRTLALHVLIGAVFGINCSFLSAMDPPDPTFTMTYRDALSFVLENFVLVLLIPSSILSLPWVPRKLARIARVSKEFRRYMTHMLEKEKQMISQRAPGRGNLMSHLVRASEEEQSAVRDGEEAEDHMQSSQGLSDSEIIGNVFLYTFAGHETTANMLSYSISLLAAHPEVQEWVAEEVHYVLQGQGTSETWEYSLFPRLKRCLAIMLETLRLYPSVGSIPKYTNDRAQSLNINGEVHIIPPKTLVFLNSFAMHKMPRYWGSDSLVWRPSRWILPSCPGTVSNGASLSSGTIFDKETLLEPKKGTFMPWSDGPRVCPGKKFAQVEFVAVLSTLLRNHRVRPVARDGEKEEDAQQRILDVVADSGIHFTLQMRHPTRVTVSWVSV